MRAQLLFVGWGASLLFLIRGSVPMSTLDATISIVWLGLVKGLMRWFCGSEDTPILNIFFNKDLQYKGSPQDPFELFQHYQSNNLILAISSDTEVDIALSHPEIITISMRNYRNPYGSFSRHGCGCYVYNASTYERTYLPQVKLDSHTPVLSTASRTVVSQTFVNQPRRYDFPLFDGISVVDFFCQVGERTIYGLVKERSEARRTYDEAKGNGETAALLEQLPQAADVFTTAISNIPKSSSVFVTIKYVQELKHDAEVDGIRLTIPTSIYPRYDTYRGYTLDTTSTTDVQDISITVDVSMSKDIAIRKIMSPSHPIEVTFGSLSTSSINEDMTLSQGSAKLALQGTKGLEKDFVLQVVAKDVGIPQALLETHPILPHQRAVMATLVPKFNLESSQKPEIIFIADLSGSMAGNIPTLVSALKVFLKSIPVGCLFNICRFGTGHSFLWRKSQLYTGETVREAIDHVEAFSASMGGTETLNAVQACFKRRNKDLPTELMLLTDGDILNQQQLLDYLLAETKKEDVRVFPIGIGGGVSSALIEGVARAGRGFAQMVGNNEKLDSKIVRMLKGALTPHIKDYRLEVKYENDSVESVADSLRLRLNIDDGLNKKNNKKSKAEKSTPKPTISLYDADLIEEEPPQNRRTPRHLRRPTNYQAALASTNTPRNTIALHFPPVVLKGTSPQGPLELEIPIEIRKECDDGMIHQLAARKATQELEEGHGWISQATTIVGDSKKPVLVKKKYKHLFELMQRREAIAEKRKQVLDAMVSRDMEEKEREDWEMVGSSSTCSAVHGRLDRSPPAAAARGHSYGMHPQFTGGRGSSLPSASQGYSYNTSPSQLSGSRGVYNVQECSGDMRGGRGGRGGGGRGGRGGREASISSSHSSPPIPPASPSPPSPATETSSSSLSSPQDPHSNKRKRQEKSNATGPLLHRLIALESYAGHWSASLNLPYRDMNINPEEVLQALHKLSSAAKTQNTAAAAVTTTFTKSKLERLFMTALVVAFLEHHMQSEEETWELVVEKARLWLQGEVESGEFLDKVWRVAKGVLATSSFHRGGGVRGGVIQIVLVGSDAYAAMSRDGNGTKVGRDYGYTVFTCMFRV
ncbi:von willebrand domain-containing [Pyrenophora seminiperda CCB06]|uniref:von willebrand domain-containing n=1 Tax=Pyrenophora seminiperda CCB06 TaxID=1302712 RepID=A0A3M7M2W7_9PLEO|nr:von willebrand domain-containing [Pyrenophora seminiperda CCB06]